jgi:hypothetical protein
VVTVAATVGTLMPSSQASTTLTATHSAQGQVAAALRSAPVQASRAVPLLGPSNARAKRAVWWSLRVTRYPTRTCLMFVRNALQVPRRYGTAMSAWRNAKHRHRTPISRIPAGVPVFSVGASPSGHIVLSLGNGWVRSTDWPRDGRVGSVRLTVLLAKWHHRYLGWSEDLNGVRVWWPPAHRRIVPHQR